MNIYYIEFINLISCNIKDKNKNKNMKKEKKNKKYNLLYFTLL